MTLGYEETAVLRVFYPGTPLARYSLDALMRWAFPVQAAMQPKAARARAKQGVGRLIMQGLIRPWSKTAYVLTPEGHAYVNSRAWAKHNERALELS